MAAQKYVVLVTTIGTLYWFDHVLSITFWNHNERIFWDVLFLFFIWSVVNEIYSGVSLNFFMLVVFKALLLQYILITYVGNDWDIIIVKANCRFLATITCSAYRTALKNIAFCYYYSFRWIGLRLTKNWISVKYLVHVIKSTKFTNSESPIFCLLAWSTVGRDTLQFINWNHATFSNSF